MLHELIKNRKRKKIYNNFIKATGNKMTFEEFELERSKPLAVMDLSVKDYIYGDFNEKDSRKYML